MDRETYMKALRRFSNTIISEAKLLALCPHLSPHQVKDLFASIERGTYQPIALPPVMVDGIAKVLAIGVVHKEILLINMRADMHVPYTAEALRYAFIHWGDDLVHRSYCRGAVEVFLVDPSSWMPVCVATTACGWTLNTLTSTTKTLPPYLRWANSIKAVGTEPLCKEEIRGATELNAGQNQFAYFCSRCGGEIADEQCLVCGAEFGTRPFQTNDITGLGILPPIMVRRLARVGIVFPIEPRQNHPNVAKAWSDRIQSRVLTGA